jgi:hypothetical protein
VRRLKFYSVAMFVSGICLAGCSSGTTGSPTPPEDGGGSSSSGGGGSGSSGGSGSGCPTFNYSGYTPASTSLTLKNDIQPMLAVTCALSGCHMSGGSPQAGLDLGPSMATTDSATLSTILTNMKAKSMTAPSLNRVTPGMPEKSFLMVKIEGDPTACSSECTAGCGLRMPFGGSALSDTEIGKFRDWIKSGAN